MLRCEQVVLNVMRNHTALKPFELMFGRKYGEAARASGFVSAENTFEILLTCLREADTALLYIKTTQNSPTPHNAAAKKDNSGGNNNSGGGGKGGGGGRDFKNKKNKTNREEFEGGLHEKRKGKGGKRRKKKREKEKKKKEKRVKAKKRFLIYDNACMARK